MDRRTRTPGTGSRLSAVQGFIVASIFNLLVIYFFTSHNRDASTTKSSSSSSSSSSIEAGRKLRLSGLDSSSAVSGSTVGAVLQAGQHQQDQPASVLGQLSSDIWTRGAAAANKSLVDEVKANLGDGEQQALREICGRCLYHSLTKYVDVLGINGPVFVATGDIPDMWIRDSSVQMGIYLPRIKRHPILRHIIEGTLRTQAYFIQIDPWANAFARTWKKTTSLNRFNRQIGRGGWVATRNFELDSGAYFLNFLWNYYNSGVWRPESLLEDPLIFDAVMRMVDVWIIETKHEELSPYRYSELPRDGMGSPVAVTGMIWSGFRASDDKQVYGYNIPANMYAAGSLDRVLLMNKAVWRSDELREKVTALREGVVRGLEAHGTVDIPDVGRIYAYEVDGLGGVLHSTDDPNLPSLLAIPFLGYTGYDTGIYANTKKVLYSEKNPYYFKGASLEGLGSTHTPHKYVWSLAHMVLGLETSDSAERSRIFRELLKMQGSNGLMHESLNVDNPAALTRPEFEWANAMFVTYFENTFGEDCDTIAEKLREDEVMHRESQPSEQMRLANGGSTHAKYFELLEFNIVHQ